MLERYSKGLKSFFLEIKNLNLFPNQQLKILDIGCADYSMFEDIKDFEIDVDAIDSDVNKIILAPPNNIVHYAHENIINYNPIDDKKYNIIFDSHAIHCITDLEDRKKALENIYNLLSPEGLFMSEMMVVPSQKDLFYYFPKRVVLPAHFIETEILELNFKIKYFMVSPNLYFEDGYGTGQKCELLRFVAQKKLTD